jgi:predicted helicase
MISMPSLRLADSYLGQPRRRSNSSKVMLSKKVRSHYHDASITKWDIFYYTYAVLHHPEYRERYAANLRRELPRIPFAAATGAKALETSDDAALKRRSSTKKSATENSAIHGAKTDDRATVEERRFSAASASITSRALAPEGLAAAAASTNGSVDVFRALAKAGKRLAEIHVQYEPQPEFKLKKTEKAGAKLDWLVTRMRLSKDKTTLIYNDFLTLSEIPKETYEYRLGNRSALEWVIDQCQVSKDKRSGIINDPNREDDPQYSLRLIGQVITVSLETVKIVSLLPGLGIPETVDE